MPLMCVSDQLWYWSHRLMHTRWAWRNLHRMHHVAPQAALSATYVHPLEYALFTVAMQLPFAIAGFPVWVVAVPMGRGMLTGVGRTVAMGGTLLMARSMGRAITYIILPIFVYLWSQILCTVRTQKRPRVQQAPIASTPSAVRARVQSARRGAKRSWSDARSRERNHGRTPAPRHLRATSSLFGAYPPPLLWSQAHTGPPETRPPATAIKL